MCIHNKRDLIRALQDSDHKIGNRWAVVWIEGADGDVRGVDCMEATDTQQVSNAVRNIRQWHPESAGGEWAVHLEHLNLQRWFRGLPPVALEDLPKPRGKAPLSSDSAEVA